MWKENAFYICYKANTITSVVYVPPLKNKVKGIKVILEEPRMAKSLFCEQNRLSPFLFYVYTDHSFASAANKEAEKLTEHLNSRAYF